MVLAERNSEIVRNGRRSRGPSPNGHIGGAGGTGTPETSSDDDNSIKRKSKTKQSEYEEKIRVGRDYQAVCPPIVAEPERKPELLNDRALLVWSPTKEIPEPKLEDYITVAKERYGYNGEQALGMLFWHKHDLERAVLDLANFTPFPDEWTVEDKVLFEQAFQFHGKSFHRIRQMLPDKSIASLVKYYYSWKKTRHRQSVMDRQEKIKANKDGSDNGSENGSNEDSENEEKVQQNKQQMSALKRKNSESSAEDLKPPEMTNRLNSRWTNDEVSLVIECFNKFGRDFSLIAETMGTKTLNDIRTFYDSHRRRYNLDKIVKTHSEEKEQKKKDEKKKKDTETEEIVEKSEADSASTAELGSPPTATLKPVQISRSATPTSLSQVVPIQAQKDDVIMEIDLDNEQTTDGPPAKKLAISTSTAKIAKPTSTV